MNLQVCTKGNQYECKLCIVVLINVQGLIYVHVQVLFELET